MRKQKKFRFAVTAVILAALFALMLKALTMAASDSNAVPASAQGSPLGIPSLFLNDSAFQLDSDYPLKIIDGTAYIPFEIFTGVGINYITLSPPRRESSNFYIMYKNKAYISFNISGNNADSIIYGTIPCKIYPLLGTFYIPAQLTADCLGLKWEYNAQYHAGRIKEPAAEKSFSELISRYIIQTTLPPPPETTTAAPVTSPPAVVRPKQTTTATQSNPVYSTSETTEIPATTVPTTTPEDTQEIDNYIIIYDGASGEPADITGTTAASETSETSETTQTADTASAADTAETAGAAQTPETSAAAAAPAIAPEKIDAVLNNLKHNNIRAMFFMSGDEILANPDILRKITAYGDDIGIKFESGRMNVAADDLILELESANALIYSAVKQKTRFCMFGDADNTGAHINNIKLYGDELKRQGYYLCGKNTDLSNISNMPNQSVNDMIILLKQKKVNIIAIDISKGGGWLAYLNDAEQASKIKPYIKISYINNANIADIFGYAGIY